MDRLAEQAAVTIWREDDNRSLIRLVPECIRKEMFLMPDDIRHLDEQGIKDRLKPTGTQNQLRLLFWIEYDRVQTSFAKNMLLVNCFRGGVSEESYLRYIKVPLLLAWIITPPTHYLVQMDALLDTGLKRLQEILDLPIVIPEHKKKSRITGKEETIPAKVDTGAANLVMKAFAYVDMRKHGAITQRMEINQKTLSVSVKSDAVDMQAAIKAGNMQEIDKRLKQLERKEKMLESGVHPGSRNQDLPDVEISSEPVAIPDLVVENMSEEDTRQANENASEV